MIHTFVYTLKMLFALNFLLWTCFHVFLQDNFSLSSSPAQNTASQVKAVTLSKTSQVCKRIR